MSWFSSAMDSKHYTERDLKQWLSDLPLGHVGQTAKRLYDKLGELGNSDLPPATRWKALMIMSPVIGDVLSTLQSHYISANPKPEDHRIARLAQAFHARMEVIAIQVASSPKRTPRGFGARNQIQRAYARALRSIGARAVIDYQRYTSPNPELWGDLHRIYQRAGGSKAARDVNRAYLALVCLAAGNPLRLSPTEIRDSFEELLACKIERYVTLTPVSAKPSLAGSGSPADEPEATWIVTDTGLRYAPHGGDGDGYLLKLNELAEAWPRLVRKNSNAGLRQRLIEEWVRKSRDGGREAVGDAGALSIVIGFASVYQKIVEADADHGTTSTSQEIGPTTAWDRFAHRFKADKRLTAHLIEHSDGGCRIRLSAGNDETEDDDTPPTLVNGDLIAMEFEPSHWRLAFVRWHQRSDRGWEVGLKNAGQDAATARVQHPTGSVRAIVTTNNGTQHVLIETKYADRASQGVPVRQGRTQQEAVITTGRLETGNPAVMIFELGNPPATPAPEPLTPTATAGATPVRPAVEVFDEFKAVWGSL